MSTTAVLPTFVGWNDILLQQAIFVPAPQRPRLKEDRQNDRYKTELCRPFEESGHCKYGAKCQFAHGKGELRATQRHPKYKTELCRTFHSSGLCPYGRRCHFVHGEAPPTKKQDQQEQQQQQQQKDLLYFRSFHLPLTRNDSIGSCGSASLSTSPSASPSLPANDDVFPTTTKFQFPSALDALPAQIRQVLDEDCCSSPLDVSKSLPTLPFFSNLHES